MSGKKQTTLRKVVVGTCRAENYGWIRDRKFYNLPLPKGGTGEGYASVTHIAVYALDLPVISRAAKYVRDVDGKWLAANGYKLSPKPHGENYALFELGGELDEAKLYAKADVYVCSTRWTGKIDEAFFDRPLPACGGKSVPNIFERIRPFFTKWRTAQAYNYTQMDFLAALDDSANQQCIAQGRIIVKHTRKSGKLTCVEICAGAGGQAIGLEEAGFEHVALVEYESEYCDVLKKNNPNWNVICADVRKFDGKPYAGVDLLAGGVPCPPFSVASKQLGEKDERDLFPEAIRLVSEMRPRAVMLENVRGLLDPKFESYRARIMHSLEALGYDAQIKLLQAGDYGVSQIRPRVIIIAMRNDQKHRFSYPEPDGQAAKSVGELLGDMMGANGWRRAKRWARRANRIAPTIVGGSKKHGGPDLGPTRARKAWAELDVDGTGVANEPPPPDFEGSPKLTKEMLAALQGFPANWDFGRKKTSACRMIGNAFPPPVAKAVGIQLRKALNNE